MIPTKAAARVLEKAAQKLGSEKALAEALGVTVVALRAYITGFEQCPETVYLRAVDIILGDSKTP